EAGRQNAERVAHVARAPAAVEHRHDGVHAQPRVVFQSSEHAWHAGAAAEATNVQLAQAHSLIILRWQTLLLRCRGSNATCVKCSAAVFSRSCGTAGTPTPLPRTTNGTAAPAQPEPRP